MRNVKEMKDHFIINRELEFNLKSLKNNSVQLIIPSPPNNIGKSYEIKKSFKEYLYEQKKTLENHKVRYQSFKASSDMRTMWQSVCCKVAIPLCNAKAKMASSVRLL